MLVKRYESARELDGVVDLGRLQSGGAGDLEANPEKFFALTYPSDEALLVLRGLSERFRSGQGAGVVLAESMKGLGKSHVMLLGFHLFQNSKEAAKWAARADCTWSPPSNTVVVVHKFTDQSLPEDALWLLVGQHLGVYWDSARPPSRAQLRIALGARPLVLILDELERGMDSIVDAARRSQNLSFLQMLGEEAAQNVRLTVFAAIYDSNREPGSTLKRTARIELRFRNPDDRAAIVRHRLFRDADSYDKQAARTYIRSCANTWKQLGLETSDAYLLRMERSFPFLPDLIDLVFERISASGGFQGTRGALGLIGAMVDAAPADTHIFTASHCFLNDKACANRLQDLEPTAHLITCASGNLRELSGLQFADSIAAAVLMASLAPGGHAPGLSKEELIRHVIKPGDNPNAFHAGLDAFVRYGTYFHEREKRYLFDLEENEHAKVELEAAKENDDIARESIIHVWQQELFKDARQSVVFTDLETTRARLAALPVQSQRFILSPKRLSQVERHALYLGHELRNQILLLEPKDERVTHLVNPDLLTFARRLHASRRLAEGAQTSERRGRFEKIQRENLNQILRLLKSGLVYVRIERWADSYEQTQFEEENLGAACTREDVLNFLRTQVFPVDYIMEHLRDHLDSVKGQSVAQIDRLYRNTLGFPVPLYTTVVPEAITKLVRDRPPVAGLQHRRGHFCGQKVTLNENDLNEAILSGPWPLNMEPLHIQSSTSAFSQQPPEPLPVAYTTTQTPAPAPVATDEWATQACHSLSELRQELARRLDPTPNAVVHSVRFAVYSRNAGQDLSDLPPAIRGNLAGRADVDVQLDFSLAGPLSKADLEDRCGRLPALSGGSYSARVKVYRSAS